MKKFLFLILFSTGCQTTGGVKVWEFIPEESSKSHKGMYRNNGKDVRTFGETDVRYCVNENDMQYILDKLSQCMDPKSLTQDEKANLLEMFLGNIK